MGRTACTQPQCLYKGALYLLLQKILDKVKKKNVYKMLIGDMNARVGNSKIINTVGTYREATLHNNGKKN